MLDRTTAAVFDRFSDEVQRVPEIPECHMAAGGFDYLLKARVADMAANRRFLGEVMVDLPGVQETRTDAVMAEVKSDAPLPL
jgi:Lrp/AsnC family transcriptional regulator, leucine-responsive regulatory protein